MLHSNFLRKNNLSWHSKHLKNLLPIIKKVSYLSQGLLQDDGDCLKSAVTSCQESFELLDAVVFSPTLCGTHWYHIRRSTTLAWLRCLMLRGLLKGAGLGFVLVHCERTCVECFDNMDHHHTPLHSCCSWSGSSTTTLQTAVGVTVKDRSSVKAFDISAVQNCSVHSAGLMIPSAAPLTAQTQKWIRWIQLAFHILIQSGALQTLVTRDYSF